MAIQPVGQAVDNHRAYGHSSWLVNHALAEPVDMPEAQLQAVIHLLCAVIAALALVRLANLFRHPVVVPVMDDSRWIQRHFFANTRRAFVAGMLLLSAVLVASLSFDFDDSLQVFIFVLVILFCGFGGLFSAYTATSRHRQYLTGTSPQGDHRAIESDLLALTAMIFATAFFFFESPKGRAVLIYQIVTIGTATLAVSVPTGSKPTFMERNGELRVNGRYMLFMLFVWLPWIVFKDTWVEQLSPLFGRIDGVRQIVPGDMGDVMQAHFTLLSLGGIMALLVLPPLRRHVASTDKFSTALSVFLGILPAALMAAFLSTDLSIIPPALSGPTLIAAAMGSLFAMFFWHLGGGLIAWLTARWFNRPIAVYPIHLLSVAGLIALGWVAIFHVEGIARHFALIALTTAMFSWSARRLQAGNPSAPAQ